MALDIANCFRTSSSSSNDVAIIRGVLCTSYLALEHLTSSSSITNSSSSNRGKSTLAHKNNSALQALLSISQHEYGGVEEDEVASESRGLMLLEEDAGVQGVVSEVVTWALDSFDSDPDSMSRSMKIAILSLMKESLLC